MITFIVISAYGLTPITQVAALSTLVGGVLFGLGIVMASGCETGMMYRLMEGQVLFLPVFAGNVIGATVLAYGWDNLGIHWNNPYWFSTRLKRRVKPPYTLRLWKYAAPWQAGRPAGRILKEIG
ncbi:hypothetical protein Q666_15070 [Marinobacter sp. ES-1]|uniref:YeeE/YedE thiosulfate transporter family protein n=1 Tax=Marinobacter sp. ES-1 TaxID=1396858 RepID=UPI0003B8B7FA|nr:YeeE/YedE thiosulfate transporter family protein [Marinobacter sp. ES-1]ERP89120.1 hypothetical protein Q666_15070 [Marinobacter sp. ES-1]